MARRSIAAALLLTTMVWAQVALVPMLVMHIWHHATVHASAAPAVIHHHHSETAAHPCCPGLQQNANVLNLEFAARGLPCSDEHRCCVSQAPPSVPAPAGTRSRLSGDLSHAQIAESGFSPSYQPETSDAFAAGVRIPPLISGMVLRV